jgi:hypothetical protein
MIANRIQEEAFGTLDRPLKMLDGLARRDGARRGERNLKIGTVLVRDYQGRRHTVTVAPEGYVWEGASYSSLSAIRMVAWSSRHRKVRAIDSRVGLLESAMPFLHIRRLTAWLTIQSDANRSPLQIPC